MIIESLILDNVRNHEHTEITFSPGANVITGANGQGKTTILEAISLCALTKTFAPCPDSALMRRGADFCFSSLTAHSDLAMPYKISISMKNNERKLIQSSHGNRLSPQEVIGELPLVVLSPDYKTITAGSPQDRRTFLDTVISQASKRYMKDVIALKHILRQRNALLSQAREHHGFDYATLEPWTESLINVGADIALRRHQFINEFSSFVRDSYAHIAGFDEEVELAYAPHSFPESALTTTLSLEDIREFYRTAFAKREREERARGVTVIGPQKDEIAISVNGGVARERASQGQHKTLLISIKIAEFHYLKQVRMETPVFLLDDIFSELDTVRAGNVLDVLRSDTQFFITTTDERLFYANFSGEVNHSIFHVNGGKVVGRNISVS